MMAKVNVSRESESRLGEGIAPKTNVDISLAMHPAGGTFKGEL
jgi:hypothetical protein